MGRKFGRFCIPFLGSVSALVLLVSAPAGAGALPAPVAAVQAKDSTGGAVGLMGAVGAGTARSAVRHWVESWRVAPRVSAPLNRLRPTTGATHAARLSTSATPAPASYKLQGPSITFDGLSNTSTHVPAQPDVAASATDVFELANPDFQIFTTSGTPLTAPTPDNQLWSTLGGPCALLQSGDWNQVFFDQAAQRWVWSRTVHYFQSGTDVSVQCLAASQTPDPTGSYYLYAFPIARGDATDYPQFAVWSNSYFLSTNLWTGPGGSGTFVGDRFVAFNRAQVLAGQPVQTLMADLGPRYESYVPATLQGSSQPPQGAPEYILGGPHDNEYRGSTLTMFTASINWSDPAQSKVAGPYNIAITPYSALVCTSSPSPTSQNCGPQPGTSVKLEAWTDNLMVPVGYWNFGSYQSIVGSFDVKSASGSNALQWFELRNPGPDTQVYQQGVYAPDSTSRYEQSIAMDANGDIAAAYTESSTSIYPSLAYAGRAVTDPLNTFGQPEQTLWQGGASQTGSTPGLPAGISPSRWGDASYLALAPDGCTFWYANEYYPDAHSVWHTRIGSFSFSDCRPG